ncbi:pyruvate dehydrogenase E2 component (dihydrolipoamide acetyltransferase) [Arthrobacter stackebrandtii]|uniref:Dihydrolipoamide acetyltransferase component of pyruvate dehydrogenase complex n=1 Tax=Arthrobacter stackebrandtii TaxID=272161 RepID=A0ABS4YS74_9MICC|nr:dihydrolipoamide acetyltransferase family protein [Arthrobacter stackebrandtii]MBP2411335.1 pyruvate dehydrogenase E2 component (dihydrolipoamide acetyltransferase) [Arthrobacter stackebrandtii]PYH00159.1 branched-chain alpha-keto acid dehydrogenase subunit E2 [Arthrobacter stackebrandtii]
MLAEFKLPDLGEGLTESEIVSWQVAVGDVVTLNQVLGEVETAKAVVELPSPYAGTVTSITHEPGTTVDVGEVIITFEVADSGAAPAPAPSGTPAAAPADEAPKRIPTLVGYGADPETSAAPVRRQRVFAMAGAPAPAVPSPTAPAPAAPAPAAHVQAERPRSTPPVRKLARDLGIELELLAGSGERGLITREDVVSFAGGHVKGAETAAAAAPSATETGPREVRTPIKGVRKAMAQAMVASAFTAPHVTEFMTVDVTAGMEFLAKLRRRREFDGVKVTPLTLAAKAVALAVARHPELNSHWDEAAQEVLTFNYLNLGIAAATPRGLLVPNIKDAHAMGLRELAVALGGLAETARAGKTQPADLAGGTFSITNIGVFGIDGGTPILNPGEAGILALGAVRKMPWEHQGQVALRDVMTLSLSFDHRLVDGEHGSRFLADVAAVVADPAMALVLG